MSAVDPGSFVRRDVTASGIRLRVAERGSGAPILFLHELCANHSSFLPLSEHLATSFRIVAPDLPGFGESEKPAPNRFPYGIHAFSEAIADLYAALDLGRATLVGHGLGGAVAITLAARHPELVTRLVLIDSLCYAAPRSLVHRALMLPLLGSALMKQMLGRSSFRALLGGRPGKAENEALLSGYYENFNSPEARSSALATLRATADTRSIVADTTRIQIPTLVIWGTEDPLYPPALGQRLAKEIRGAGLALVPVGHFPHEERAEEVARLIERFLNKPSLRPH